VGSNRSRSFRIPDGGRRLAIPPVNSQEPARLCGEPQRRNPHVALRRANNRSTGPHTHTPPWPHHACQSWRRMDASGLLSPPTCCGSIAIKTTWRAPAETKILLVVTRRPVHPSITLFQEQVVSVPFASSRSAFGGGSFQSSMFRDVAATGGPRHAIELVSSAGRFGTSGGRGSSRCHQKRARVLALAHGRGVYGRQKSGNFTNRPAGWLAAFSPEHSIDRVG
jgi:hypothetical protein